MILTVSDPEGNVVRRLNGPASAGFNRVTWDLRYPAFDPTDLTVKEQLPWDRLPYGPLAAPGRYTVSLAKRVGGVITPLGQPQSFAANPLGAASLPPADRKDLLAFEEKTGRLQRAVLGAVRAAAEARTRIDHLKKALADAPAADPKLAVSLRELETRLKDLQKELSGDSTISDRSEPTPPSIVDRVQTIVNGHWDTTTAPTSTHRRNYDIAAKQFAPVLASLRALSLTDLKQLEDRADAAGAPWTPGRVPEWKAE